CVCALLSFTTLFFFFFFQAEDGIRDFHVTGVQTCALPILKQAQQLQSRMAGMQAELDAAEVEGRAGGGLVSVVMSGKGEVKKVSDRKSTRLNSSHVKISYAVFCLKKKKKVDEAAVQKKRIV